jgi:hypothetical protein
MRATILVPLLDRCSTASVPPSIAARSRMLFNP